MLVCGGQPHSGPAPHPTPCPTKRKTGTEKGWTLKSRIRISINIFLLYLLELERGQRSPGYPTLPQPYLGEPQPKSHHSGGVTHGRARGPRRCCPGSRCRRRISSAPGCSGCSCRRTPRAGTAAGGCRTDWLPRGKHRQDFNQVTKSRFPRGKNPHEGHRAAYPGR